MANMRHVKRKPSSFFYFSDITLRAHAVVKMTSQAGSTDQHEHSHAHWLQQNSVTLTPASNSAMQCVSHKKTFFFISFFLED